MRRPQCGTEQKKARGVKRETVTDEHAKTGQPQDSANKSGYTFRFNIIRKTVRELIS